MYLKNISLINFKNHQALDLVFDDRANAICGNNGIGKTAVLDAVHYLCLCKSYFNAIDTHQINFGQDFFLVKGEFDKGGQEKIVSCGLKRNQKKTFKLNNKEYERLAEHVGEFPLVIITPNDVGLILEGSEERRRFVDNVISQDNSQYLNVLIQYNKNLLNRNILLKKIAETGRYDPDLLDIYDSKLIELGQTIFETRKMFLESFLFHFDKYYQFLSGGKESVSLVYSSQLIENKFEDLLKQSIEKDRVLERTNVGPHKDDLLFLIDQVPLKRYASQGQQKTFLIALKLAQYEYLKQQKGLKPLLLLDDIFDKLDQLRVHKLIELVSEDTFGQIFITDTEKDRVKKIFEQVNIPLNLISLS